MKKLFLTLFLLIAFPVLATHIVGGEFELIHVSGNTYKLNMILYFDKKNGDPGAKDPSATVAIFRKSDNFQMAIYTLPRVSETEVLYAQPACSDGSIQTTKLVYSLNITLSQTVYTDPAGYYVSWQRCCRNYSILNIYSPQPPLAPQITSDRARYAGQTFYLEFPPVVKNGEPFIDSSPRLFPPLSDYACPFRPYYVDFGGVDDDGDSLVYSMTTPLTTKTSEAGPPASPKPYPEVLWRSPYSLSNIIDGIDDLKIRKDGLLTCTLGGTQGLFVFAIKVEEFRKGEKIGESRRDFQLFIVDKCPIASPPAISGKKLTDAGFGFTKNMDVTFSNTVTNSDRCIQVRVSDLDSTKPDQGFSENIGIRVVGLNFKSPNLNQILPSVTTATLTNGSTRDFQICFPQCPYINGSYQVGIIAFDDACTLPLSDTLKVVVNVQPPTNGRARFVKPTSKKITEAVREGDFRSWDIEGTDVDNDDLTLLYTTNAFKLEEYGFALAPYVTTTGSVKTQLTWDPKCDVYPFFKQSNFRLRFLLDDNDLPCKLNPPDTLLFNLTFQEFPKNSPPTIVTSGLGASPTARKISLQRKVFDQLNFSVTGSDVDNDFLVLSGKGLGFNLADYGITFPNTTGNGTVSNNFNWNIKCAKLDLAKKDKYTFQFIVVDNQNKCRFYKADTVEVEVKISKPDNAKPVVTAFTPSLQNVSNGNLNVILGEPIEINLLGTDADLIPTKDSLRLNLVSAAGDLKPEGYTFKNAKGLSGLQSLFSWNPDCSIFKNNVYSNNYSFKFNLLDNRCLNAKGDTVTVNLKISDVNGTDKKFQLPNVFTPNNDRYNDYFALEGIDPSPTEGINLDNLVNLPNDNCVQQFQSVKIFNRWGDQVFESTDRKFRWYAPQESAGVYYYVVKYNNREYKSSLSVRF